MEFQNALITLKKEIKNIDNYSESFKGFDVYYDTSWTGHYYCEIKLSNGNYLYFDGEISFNIEDHNMTDIKVESFNDFQLWDNKGELIQNYLNN